jgi:cobalt-zinc-cadmium efflux system protein
LTGGFMIAEIIGGILAGSLALLADAGHMLTDFAASRSLGSLSDSLGNPPIGAEPTASTASPCS